MQIISLKQEETRRGGALIAIPLFSLVNSTASAGNTAVERSAMLSSSFFHTFTLFRT